MSALTWISGFLQFGSRDGSRGSESSAEMGNAGSSSKAEPPALFSRTAPKGMFGAHSAYSYGGPPGPAPAQVFQESRLLYLAEELPVLSRARAPRLPEQGDNSQAEDPSEGYEEGGPEGLREKPPSPAEKPGNRVLSTCSLPVGLLWGSSFLTVPALVHLSMKSRIHLSNVC